MRTVVLVAALCLPGSQGFAPSFVRQSASALTTQNNIKPRLFGVPDAFSSFSLADALDGFGEAGDIGESAVGVVSGVADVVDAVPEGTDNGWFGFLTGPIEGLLDFIHTAAVALGTDANAWGISIILLTILIKIVTFPLTKSQLESTTKMQAMSPAIKEIQAKYQSNPEVMNQKVAEFYQVNEINPLAGCLPSLVQIPIFIGLYRAVLNLAQENKLNEPFLFLPSLEGPTYGADPAHGSDWLFQNWTPEGPPLGWDDTISFLILPVLLIASQFASMELMQPKTDDQQQNNPVLKVLPLLIGWFSLNVPAALCVYWFVNNIVTTGMSVAIRSTLDFEPVAAGGSAAAASTMEPPPTIFAPPREKPAGFGQAAGERAAPRDAVKPITAIDAEVVEKVPEPKVAKAPEANVVKAPEPKVEKVEKAPEPEIEKAAEAVKEITASAPKAAETKADPPAAPKPKRKRSKRSRKKKN